MFSYCDLSEELDHLGASCDSNTLCPEPCNNSTYYEENTVYNGNSEPCIERCKNIKTKHPWSPVEIYQESAVNIDLPPISWHDYGSVPKILNVINTGRTVLINGQWTKSRPYISGGPLNGSYIFSQIHFHSPSEHEIDGKRYPLEMHVVHYKTSYLTQERAVEEKDGTVVIVYLFEVLQTDTSVLSSITNSVHLIEGVNDRTELTDVTLYQILQPVFSNYYIYWGSVSTSKKSYLLQWIISCTNLCVSQKELDKLIKILGSNETFVESQASQMNIINNIIYHVEGYDLPLEVNNSGGDVMPKCYCRYHCQNCKICVIHQEEYLQFHITEPHSFSSKELGTKDTELQTSCEKTSKATKKLSLRNCKQIQTEIMKCVEITSASSCLSLNSNSNSKSSTCEDKKKNTKQKKCAKKIPIFKDSDDRKEVIVELKTCSSCPSADENLKSNSDVKSKNMKEKDRKAKSKKVMKRETSSCETLKSSSRGSQKNPKTLSKKKVTKNTSKEKGTDPSSKSNKSNKKEKQKSKQKKATKSESSADSLKNSESVKQEKKKKGGNKDKNCDLQVEVRCLSVLESTGKIGSLVVESNISEENKKVEKLEESKKENEELFIVCEKPSAPLKDVRAEKASIYSDENYNEVDGNIKTIYQKNEALNNSAPTGNDYAINFLLSPNTLRSKCSPLTSESECLEAVNNGDSNHNIAVKESMSKVPKLGVSPVESPEQWKDVSFEMEHLFRTERKGDFATCVTQEYNVAIVCNHNIIQEFRGIFHPNKLKLGIYEKLPLIPKYPEPENDSVHLDDCFIKKESADQLYIRAKFLLNNAKINDFKTRSKNIFEEEIKRPDLELSDVKSNQPDCVEEEKRQVDDNAENKKNFSQSDLKTKVLENEEYKDELLKKLDSKSEQDSKNTAFDCLQQSFKQKKEEEQKENNLIEKTDKTIKDLFHKRKRVYFSCEKIEKDENSGKKVLVGSFRTKKELKALSKDKILVQEADASSVAEKSVGSDKEKSLSLCEESRGKLVKTEKSKAKPKYKSQSPVKGSKSDKSNESKNLITLHKHKPKN